MRQSYFKITDFRETPEYLHKKLCTKENDVTDILCSYLYNNYTFQYLKDNIVIDIKEQVTELTKDNIPRIKLFDGFYDIWLRGCKDITHITIELEGIGPVYSKTFKDRSNGDIQIPLAFDTNGKSVDYLMYKYTSYYNREASFIPTLGLQHKKMKIIINEGAECSLCFSTVYFPHGFRYELSVNNIYFYVGGQRYKFNFSEFSKVDDSNNKIKSNKSSKSSNRTCWFFNCCDTKKED